MYFSLYMCEIYRQQILSTRHVIATTLPQDPPLRELLVTLGLSAKEARLYLLILELGTHPATTLAKRLSIPKSTVLFMCNRLVQRGVVRRSQRGRTQFYGALPDDLLSATKAKLEEQERALSQAIPLLNEIKNPFSARPAVTFYEGVDGCRKAYRKLLDSSTEILEFGIHKDLVEKLGQRFMDNFIRERTKKGVFLRAISNSNDVDRELHRRDKAERRDQRFFSPTFGKIYSSMAVYENKVLVLNLHADTFGILIENTEVSETLRTIFSVLWKKLNYMVHGRQSNPARRSTTR